MVLIRKAILLMKVTSLRHRPAGTASIPIPVKCTEFALGGMECEMREAGLIIEEKMFFTC